MYLHQSKKNSFPFFSFFFIQLIDIIIKICFFLRECKIFDLNLKNKFPLKHDFFTSLNLHNFLIFKPIKHLNKTFILFF